MDRRSKAVFLFSDLPELVRDYENGAADWIIAYSVLLRLLGDHEVDEVMRALSPGLGARFDESLHEEFGGEDTSGTVIWIDNAGGDPPNRDRIVASIMRWIERRTSTQET